MSFWASKAAAAHAAGTTTHATSAWKALTTHTAALHAALLQLSVRRRKTFCALLILSIRRGKTFSHACLTWVSFVLGCLSSLRRRISIALSCSLSVLCRCT
ncbi:hypothetical protein D3C78_1556200 [compost metagenome]